MRLKSLLDEESIELDELVIDRLEHFAILLHEWNGIHNLTGAKSIDAIYHNIIDSLYPITFIDTPSTLLDVGTGAGFPGLVLAIALDSTKVVLAEPIKKRVSFLRYATIDIGLSSVIVQGSRVEDIEHEPFDLITSRAVTNTQLLLELTKEISDSSTAYLFYKGERVFDEIESFKNQLNYDIVQKNRRNYLYIKP